MGKKNFQPLTRQMADQFAESLEKLAILFRAYSNEMDNDKPKNEQGIDQAKKGLFSIWRMMRSWHGVEKTGLKYIERWSQEATARANKTKAGALKTKKVQKTVEDRLKQRGDQA